MINDFNEYSTQNNLNIKLNLSVYKSSTIYDDFGSYIESLLRKKANKYDLYYYDVSYAQVYGEYLLDLKQYLDPSHIELYDPKIVSELCIYEDKLVGLVRINFFLS